MRQWMAFALLAVCLGMAPPGWAAEASAKPDVETARKAEQSVALPLKDKGKILPEETAAKGEAGKEGEAAKDADICAIQASESQSQIRALQEQVNLLQQQINQKAMPQMGKIPDMAIRTKNLPAGNYRERCFSCMTMPDEDGERVLFCTCPVGETSLERLSINLTLCAEGQEISYCAGMLTCGLCRLDQNLSKTLPPVAPESAKLNEVEKMIKGPRQR